MKILFDQGTPVPLRRYLHPHSVDTTSERSWSTLKNGELLNQAESNGYEVFITTDRNLKYQQNLTGRKVRILVLTTTSWPRISKKADLIRDALSNLNEGGYVEVEI
jgi:predicted nuclease of predicted toxin-antitoxin system